MMHDEIGRGFVVWLTDGSCLMGILNNVSGDYMVLEITSNTSTLLDGRRHIIPLKSVHRAESMNLEYFSSLVKSVEEYSNKIVDTFSSSTKPKSSPAWVTELIEKMDKGDEP